MTNKDCDVTLLSMIATRNTRDIMRDWCAGTDYPLPNLIGRGRAVREAGLLTQGALGINAPAATLRDGAVLLLAITASRTWKDAPAEVERYGSLPIYKTTGHDPITRTDFDPDEVPYGPEAQLVDVLTDLLEHCGSRREARLLSLKVDRSERSPAAFLTFGLYEGEAHTKTFFLTFMRRTGQNDAVWESGQMNDVALNTMADLLVPNVAAANRARMQAEHETGPSVPPDEPIPFDNLPWATTPTATDTHPEANDKETKTQVGFKSCGGSSGGSPLPPTEFCDDLDDRPDRPSPCAA
jgi:hypothetical protein